MKQPEFDFIHDSIAYMHNISGNTCMQLTEMCRCVLHFVSYVISILITIIMNKYIHKYILTVKELD
jgi:hypothetical protein